MSDCARKADSSGTSPIAGYRSGAARISYDRKPLSLFPIASLCALIIGSLVIFSGCSTQRFITARSIPFNPLTAQLSLTSSKGPQASGRTLGLLRKYDLLPTYNADIRKCYDEVQKLSEIEPEAEIVYAISELAYIIGTKSQRDGNADDALDMFGVAVAHAYIYLFSPRLDAIRNPYDPRFRGACDLYNYSLEATLRLVQKKGELKPGGNYRFKVGGNSHLVQSVVLGPWRASDFERFEFCSDFEVDGLPNPNVTYGLGVPLIAVRKRGSAGASEEKYYPDGLSFAVTALLRVVDENATPNASSKHRHSCVLEFHDPLASSDITLANRLVPLQVDLATPLAYFLDSPQFKEQSDYTVGFLNPNQGQQKRGIYMLEPFDKNRIPVIMVHGLLSSPVTWMPMFNDLRSFPELRKSYQFWFYQYPSGQPFWTSAKQLRAELAELRTHLDPYQQNDSLDQMVLVGHSMGGLVSRMQTIESGDEFWRILTDRPYSELKGEDDVKKQLADAVFFEPNHSIRRVITIGTPHRGSNYANDYTQWLGRKFIELPATMVVGGNELARENPNFFRDTKLLTTQTSIDSLSPKSPIFPVMLRAKTSPSTKYHNIIGLVPEKGFYGRFSAGTDGVVELASAQIDGVESELVVEAEHQEIHTTPRAILEVRRILKDHLNQLQAPARYALNDNAEQPNSANAGNVMSKPNQGSRPPVPSGDVSLPNSIQR